MRQKTRGNWDDLGIYYPEGECDGRTVFEAEDGGPVATGLLDARGNMIMREVVRERIGFRLRK